MHTKTCLVPSLLLLTHLASSLPTTNNPLSSTHSNQIAQPHNLKRDGDVSILNPVTAGSLQPLEGEHEGGSEPAGFVTPPKGLLDQGLTAALEGGGGGGTPSQGSSAGSDIGARQLGGRDGGSLAALAKEIGQLTAGGGGLGGGRGGGSDVPDPLPAGGKGHAQPEFDPPEKGVPADSGLAARQVSGGGHAEPNSLMAGGDLFSGRYKGQSQPETGAPEDVAVDSDLAARQVGGGDRGGAVAALGVEAGRVTPEGVVPNQLNAGGDGQSRPETGSPEDAAGDSDLAAR